MWTQLCLTTTAGVMIVLQAVDTISISYDYSVDITAEYCTRYVYYYYVCSTTTYVVG
jgi:hypothetical protein